MIVFCEGKHKDEKMINYVRKNYLTKDLLSNIVFVNGMGEDEEHHIQTSESELRNLVFGRDNKNTYYLFAHFFIDRDRRAYLKLFAEMCEKDIPVFITEQVIEHVTSDIDWVDKYCEVIKCNEY